MENVDDALADRAAAGDAAAAEDAAQKTRLVSILRSVGGEAAEEVYVDILKSTRER
jgi:hypothetical protein